MSETKKKEVTEVRRVKNAILYSDGTILVENVRLSYPHVFKAFAGDDGGEPKFGCTGLMPKATHVEAKDLIVAEIAKLLKANKLEKLPPEKKFLRNGDDSVKDGYAGNWSISAREERRPLVLGKDGSPLDPVEDRDEVYGGCWGNMLIRPWFQSNKFGKRVNAGLALVRKRKDDTPFGEGRTNHDELARRFGAESYDDDLGGAGGAPDDDDDL